MKQLVEWFKKEPAVIFMAIRFLLVVIAATSFGSWLTEDVMNEILMFLGAVLAIDVGTTLGTRSKVYSQHSAEEIAATTTPMSQGTLVTPDEAVPQGSVPANAGAYVVEVVRSLVPIPQLPFGLKVVSDLVTRYSNMALTDERRKVIQREVHRRLRKARILKGHTFPTSAVFLVLVLALSACTPISRFATGALNEAAGDSAALGWEEMGFVFHPGDAPAVGVIVDVLGEDMLLTAPTEQCAAEEDGSAIVCTFPLVDAPQHFYFERGTNVTVSVSYRRTPDGRVYAEFLTD